MPGRSPRCYPEPLPPGLRVGLRKRFRPTKDPPRSPSPAPPSAPFSSGPLSEPLSSFQQVWRRRRLLSKAPGKPWRVKPRSRSPPQPQPSPAKSGPGSRLPAPRHPHAPRRGCGSLPALRRREKPTRGPGLWRLLELPAKKNDSSPPRRIKKEAFISRSSPPEQVALSHLAKARQTSPERQPGLEQAGRRGLLP